MSESLSRRDFVRQGTGALLLTFLVGGCEKKMTPTEAVKAEVPLGTLTAREALKLGLLGEACVPGAKAAGIVPYVDHQLTGSIGDCMLMIKYLGVPAPFSGFYRGGLAGIEAAAQKRRSKEFSALTATERQAFVGDLAAGKLEGWQGPPQAFFHFVARTDAIDVTYGTEDGFASLGVPYMPHIAPPSNWGA